MMIKFCPDLTGYEEREGLMVGSGKFRVPTLNTCIKDKCVAYKEGNCMKYDNNTEYFSKEELENMMKKRIG